MGEEDWTKSIAFFGTGLCAFWMLSCEEE